MTTFGSSQCQTAGPPVRGEDVVFQGHRAAWAKLGASAGNNSVADKL